MTNKTHNDFASIIPHVFNVEGDIGADSAYGIDIKAFPKEFEEAKRITKEQGRNKAVEYATNFYKDKFWDARNMDSVPAETRDVVFDTTINHSYKFSEYVISAAKNGASREDLLEMRKTEYERLATVKPEKYAKNLKGWLNRLDTFRSGKTGEHKAAEYRFTDQAGEETPNDNRVEISRTRPAQEDEEDQYQTISKLMETNPFAGLLMLLFGLLTGDLDFGDMKNLMGTFDRQPDEKKAEALRKLPSAYKEKYDSMRQLLGLSENLPDVDGGEKAAALAEKFIGEKEQGGNNCGAIVQLSGVAQGQPWCGGFAEYIFSQTMPDVYKGANFKSAASYKEYGEKYGAFHEKGDGYKPEVGDAILFHRNGGSGYHVGIVSAVNGDKITYISGNDGNKVDKDIVDLHDQKLAGFTSSRTIAEKKHIDIGKKAGAETAAEIGVNLSDLQGLPEPVRSAVAKLDLGGDGIISNEDSRKAKSANDIIAQLKESGVVITSNDTGKNLLQLALEAAARKFHAAPPNASIAR